MPIRLRLVFLLLLRVIGTCYAHAVTGSLLRAHLTLTMVSGRLAEERLLDITITRLRASYPDITITEEGLLEAGGWEGLSAHVLSFALH